VTSDVVHFVEVEVQGRTTVRFALDPTNTIDPISGWLLLGHPLNDPPIDLVLSLLDSIGRPGMLLDVGAHLGTIALTAATLGHRVIAVEASPTNARLLRLAAAFSAHRAVLPIHAYAGTGAGTVDFLDYGPWGHQVLPNEAAQGCVGVSVPVVSVDQVLARRPRPDVVKIDVEGAEVRVLAGMRGLLEGEPPPPPLVVESNVTALEEHGSSPEALHQSLESFGYTLHLLDRLRSRTLVPWRAGDLQTECVGDILATVGPPRLPGWVVAPRFRPEDIVERLVVSAADPVAGNRAYAARLILDDPRLRDNKELRLVLRTLETDADQLVRDAARDSVGRHPSPWP
jgi:FkbM family methyltransferase